VQGQGRQRPAVAEEAASQFRGQVLGVSGGAPVPAKENGATLFDGSDQSFRTLQNEPFQLTQLL
jgi:hypothetical protein